jgi:hypothetical protein
MPGTIGPPQVSTPGLGERPIRQVPDGRGGWVTTKLTDEEMRDYDARERARIDGGAEALKAQYRARLYGDPGADAAARQGPDPRIRLATSRQAFAEATAKVVEHKAAKGRAERHLRGAEAGLAAVAEHRRRADAARVAGLTKAIAEGREPAGDDEPGTSADVARAQDRVAVARRALEAISDGLAQGEQAVTRAAQEVHAAAETCLACESEDLADQLAEAEREVSRLRADLRSLSLLWIAPPQGRAHPIALTPRVVRTLNNPDTTPPTVVTDWSAKLRELVSG